MKDGLKALDGWGNRSRLIEVVIGTTRREPHLLNAKQPAKRVLLRIRGYESASVFLDKSTSRQLRRLLKAAEKKLK